MKWNESGFRPLLYTYRLNGWWDEWDDTSLLQAPTFVLIAWVENLKRCVIQLTLHVHILKPIRHVHIFWRQKYFLVLPLPPRPPTLESRIDSCGIKYTDQALITTLFKIEWRINLGWVVLMTAPGLWRVNKNGKTSIRLFCTESVNPASTSYWSNVKPILAHCLRHMPNIESMSCVCWKYIFALDSRSHRTQDKHGMICTHYKWLSYIYRLYIWSH